MEQNNNTDSNNHPQVDIRKIYVKDVSWESPNSPDIFQQNWEPDLHIELQNKSRNIDDDEVEITIRLTITCKNNKKVAFIVEVEQAGIFTIKNLEGEEREKVVGIFCPNTLFPYIRSYIDNLVVSGGFAPITIAPISFDVIYEKKKEYLSKEQQEQEESSAGSSSNSKVMH